ncbi:MAG: hypothetical protein HQK83_15360 [Fibrobacteria bacterium]|nr:hypothetical protein [Fibrobacteria bacterium]
MKQTAIIIILTLTLACGATKVSVLDLEGRDLPVKALKKLSYKLKIKLNKTDAYSVVNPKIMLETLKTRNFSLTSCTSGECVAEIGRIMKSEAVISGSIKKIGAFYIITLNETNTISGMIEKTVEEKMSCNPSYIMTTGLNNLITKMTMTPDTEETEIFDIPDLQDDVEEENTEVENIENLEIPDLDKEVKTKKENNEEVTTNNQPFELAKMFDFASRNWQLVINSGIPHKFADSKNGYNLSVGLRVRNHYFGLGLGDVWKNTTVGEKTSFKGYGFTYLKGENFTNYLRLNAGFSIGYWHLSQNENFSDIVEEYYFAPKVRAEVGKIVNLYGEIGLFVGQNMLPYANAGLSLDI